MIDFKDISLVFNEGSENELRALSEVSLSIQQGEFLVLIGANGSGKSSLLNVLAGSIQQSQGKILIDNNCIDTYREFERSKWISRIFQDPLSGTAPNLSLIDNCRLASIRTKKKGLKIANSSAFSKEVREKVSVLNMGLEDRLDQKCGSLSGGQRQALTLIMAVMDDARILLMDEPTAALDPRSSEVLLKAAENVIEMYQLTTIFVTHQLKDAHRIGNRLIQMENGAIIRDLDSIQKQETPLTEYFKWFA